MRLSKVIASAVAMGVVCVGAVESPNGLSGTVGIGNSDGNTCGHQETVYVTVTAPASTIDVAVTSASIQSATSVDVQAPSKNVNLQPAAPIDTATDITATSTIFITHTQFVQVASATPTSSVAGYGEPYASSEHDGTTNLQNGNPPSTTQDSLTRASTVQAAPLSTEPTQQSSSDGTIFLTLTSTIHLTRTIVEVHNGTSTSARSFTGIGAGGWNATGTTLQTVKGGPTGSGISASGNQAHQTGVVPALPNGLSTGYTDPIPSPSGRVYRKKGKRQVGAVVVATIEGAVVSWTNAYDGAAPATSLPSLPVKAEPPLVPAPVSSPAGYGVQQPSSVPSPPLKAEPPLVPGPATSPAGYGAPQALSVAVPPSTLSQTSDASKQITTMTAAPTTVTEGVQLGTGTTGASSITAHPSWTNVSSSTAPPAPTTTNCGEVGNFTLNFDDLLAFSPVNNDTADYPPIFNPYHHLYFSGGYAYAPPPTDPFQPSSAPHLAVFTANMTGQPLVATGPTEVGDDILGEFGAGPRARNSAYWIDVYGASMGCDNRGPEECTITFSGSAYLKSSDEEIIQVSASAAIPPCPELRDCPLHPVQLGDNFTGLSGLRIVARVGDKPVIWFIDDVQLGWSNNTCAAGLERSRHR